MAEKLTRRLDATSLEDYKRAYEEIDLLVGHNIRQLPHEIREQVGRVCFSIEPVLKGRHAIHEVRAEPPEAACVRVEIQNPVFGLSSVFDLYSDGEVHLLGSLEAIDGHGLVPDDLISSRNFTLYHPQMRTISPVVELTLEPFS